VYDEAIKTKIINESNFESKLLNIQIYKLDLNLHWVSKWANLSRNGVEKNISIKEYTNLINKTAEFRSNELYESNYIHTWKIYKNKMNLELLTTIHCKFELPDGSKICGKTKLSLKNITDIHTLYDIKNYSRTNNVNINLKDDDFTVKFKNMDKEFNFKSIQSIKEPINKNMDLYNKLIAFATSKGRWTQGTIQQLEHKNNQIRIPIQFEDETVYFTFNSKESDNGLWDLANEFGYDDPLLLEGEKVYISFKPFRNKDIKSIIENELWIVNSSKNTFSENKYILKIKDIIKNILY